MDVDKWLAESEVWLLSCSQSHFCERRARPRAFWQLRQLRQMSEKELFLAKGLQSLSASYTGSPNWIPRLWWITKGFGHLFAKLNCNCAHCQNFRPFTTCQLLASAIAFSLLSKFSGACSGKSASSLFHHGDEKTTLHLRNEGMQLPLMAFSRCNIDVGSRGEEMHAVNNNRVGQTIRNFRKKLLEALGLLSYLLLLLVLQLDPVVDDLLGAGEGGAVLSPRLEALVNGGRQARHQQQGVCRYLSNTEWLNVFRFATTAV